MPPGEREPFGVWGGIAHGIGDTNPNPMTPHGPMRRLHTRALVGIANALDAGETQRVIARRFGIAQQRVSQLARPFPDKGSGIVEYVPVSGLKHAKGWNVSAPAGEAATKKLLTSAHAATMAETAPFLCRR